MKSKKSYWLLLLIIVNFSDFQFCCMQKFPPPPMKVELNHSQTIWLDGDLIFR